MMYPLIRFRWKLFWYLWESPWKYLIFWYVILWEYAQQTRMHHPWEPCVGYIWWVHSMIYVLTSWSLCYMPWFVILARFTTVIHGLPSTGCGLGSPSDAMVLDRHRPKADLLPVWHQATNENPKDASNVHMKMNCGNGFMHETNIQRWYFRMTAILE